MTNPSLPLFLTAAMPVMQTDLEWHILGKNYLLQKDRHFSARQSIAKQLSLKDRDKLIRLPDGSSTALTFVLEADIWHSARLSSPAYYSCFVQAEHGGLTYYMPRALQTNLLLSEEELDNFRVPEYFAESLRYIHRFPNLTLPTLIAHYSTVITEKVFVEDFTFLSFKSIIETICRLLWEDDILTENDSLPDMITEDPARAFMSLGKLLPHIAKDPSVKVTLEVENNMAIFKRKSVRIPVSPVREMKGVSIIRPFFFTKSEAAAAILIASIAELIMGR